jgi:transcriptional regulator with XRE-family HTH domain
MHMRTLKEILYRKCVTQKQLAKKAGRSQAMISAVCRGERNPGAGTRKEIARALGVPPENLFRMRKP